jgi:hypothetical protein
MNNIPQQLHHLFWDIDPASFDPGEFPQYTIKRILESGDEQEASWMKETFSDEQIKEVIRSERSLTPKSAQFWATLYHLPVREVAALKG